MQFFLLNLLLLYTTNHNYTVPPTEGNRGGLPLSINAPDKIIWSAVPGCRYPSLPLLPVGSSRSIPVVSNASMLDLIIIALFAGFLGIFTYDFFTKKKTEVNGAHVVVGFQVGVLIVHSRVTRSSPLIWLIPQTFLHVTVNLPLFQVTGGSSGIGKAVAIKLAKCGANITILARNMVRQVS